MKPSLNRKIYSGHQFSEIRNNAFLQEKTIAISFVNPFSYYEVQKSDSLIDGIDYYFSDGALLCMLHNLFSPKISRASFDYSSIAKPFLEYVEQHNKRLAVIGATSSENAKAVEVLKKQYPNLNIVFNRDGYIDDIEPVVNQIEALEVDVVLVGMGTPYQEKFCVEAKKKLTRPMLLITCGGFLTQTSIKPDYYNPIIKKLGLRWLQRMIMHKHVRDRVIKQYPAFVINYLTHMIFKKR
ncbi:MULTISPECIES: WecB/TagA/CpsF family glycosyltransferase [Pseudoalteromonas]|uniref:WecB/TagA/CpsF family glycosyltransferase n=1 Tax=Pseudoalteromonas TaxID=53246 RepID=UPI000FFF1653|nr:MULTISPECIES: WecB/TagA/CpsF family glycosyltransferase [Pseudoalteromonas]NKC17426.1 teichoic acid biosynthesis protein A [Pseudoalteromonas galatheae]RXE84529.1 teichoic acid biosynthesis protein A [Pseudoalteromonas sp. A757]